MQTQVLKTADGFKTEVTLRSIVRAPFYKHGKEDGNILKYLAATADGSYFAFFIDLKEDEEILELILLAEKGDRVVFEFQQGEEKTLLRQRLHQPNGAPETTAPRLIFHLHRTFLKTEGVFCCHKHAVQRVACVFL